MHFAYVVVWLFTAAQAAQKEMLERIRDTLGFTAAQAAQKVERRY